MSLGSVQRHRTGERGLDHTGHTGPCGRFPPATSSRACGSTAHGSPGFFITGIRLEPRPGPVRPERHDSSRRAEGAWRRWSAGRRRPGPTLPRTGSTPTVRRLCGRGSAGPGPPRRFGGSPGPRCAPTPSRLTSPVEKLQANSRGRQTGLARQPVTERDAHGLARGSRRRAPANVRGAALVDLHGEANRLLERTCRRLQAA